MPALPSLRLVVSTILALACSGILACGATQAATDEPTLPQRDAVEEWLSGNMVLPETALWKFEPVKPYLGSGKLLCGAVNYQSLMRRYVGYHRFYAIMYDDRVTLAQIENPGEDPSGRLHAKLELLCGKG